MFLLLSILTIFMSSATAQEQSYCYATQDCATGQICTTELGECFTPPDCDGEYCPAVCSGVCVQNPSSNSSISLGAPLSLEEVFITADCPNGCQQLLWLKLIEGVSQKLKVGTTVQIDLELYDEEAKLFEPTLAVAKPLTSPNGTIDSFSIGLPQNSPTASYPILHYYKLTITYNLEPYVWLIKVRQETPEYYPSAMQSTLNPTADEFADFFDPVSKPVSVIQTGINFPDLQDGTLIKTAAYNLSARNIISGYPDGTFKQFNLVNRAEAAKFLLNSRYENLIVKPGVSKFPDTQIGAWYEPYILFASSNGIINGYPDGTFRPANTVNTAEFLKMLTLTFNLPLNLPSEYIDVETTDWFGQYAGVAKYYNLFPKRPSYVLYPNMLLTREEVAIAIDTLITALDNQ